MVAFAVMFAVLIIQVSALTFEEWLPFELSWNTVIWYLFVLGMCIAGGSAGIAAKHYQSQNWKPHPEDAIYYLMVISTSPLLLVMQTPLEQVFFLSAGINGGLGVLRNMVNDRKEKKP